MGGLYWFMALVYPHQELLITPGRGNDLLSQFFSFLQSWMEGDPIAIKWDGHEYHDLLSWRNHEKSPFSIIRCDFSEFLILEKPIFCRSYMVLPDFNMLTLSFLRHKTHGPVSWRMGRVARISAPSWSVPTCSSLNAWRCGELSSWKFCVSLEWHAYL